MPKRIDYSLELSEIAAPKVTDVSPLIQDIQTSGANRDRNLNLQTQIDIASKQNTLDFLKLAGSTAAAVGKSYMEKSAEMEIHDVTQKLPMFAEKDIEANNRRLRGEFAESYGSDDFMGTQTVGHFTEEARKYATARNQGVISQEEAIAQIGSIIKRYSAMVPQWASDFRKVGAQMTGISNIDAYGVHQALTAKSAMQRDAERRQEVQLQLDKEIASNLGIALDQVDPAARAFHQRTKQYALQVQNLKQQAEVRNMVQEEVDQVNDQIASVYVTGAMSGVAAEFAQMHAAHLNSDTPLKRDEAMKLGGQLAAKFDVLEAQLVSQINGLTVGRNPMKRDRAAKVVGEVRSMFKDWKDAVKTAEGFNLWSQQVKNAKGDVEKLVADMSLAHPHLVTLKELHIMPELAKAWFGLGDAKAFAARFGQPAADAFQAVLQNPAYGSAFRDVAKGKLGLDQVSAVDPNLGKVLYNDAALSIEYMVKNNDELEDQQKEPFSHLLGEFSKQLRHTNPTDLKKFQETMFNPKTVTLLQQLSPEQRANALAPFVAKVDLTVPQSVRQVRTAVDSFNTQPTNQEQGHSVKVVRDPASNMFRLETTRGQGKADHRSVLSSMVSPRFHPEQREQIEAIQRELDWLNTVTPALGVAVPLMNDGAKFDSGNVSQTIEKGIESGEMKPFKFGVSTPIKEVPVPRNQSSEVKIPTERAAAQHVAATGLGEEPLTVPELKELHSRRIKQIEEDMKMFNHPRAKQVLEDELAREKRALAELR